MCKKEKKKENTLGKQFYSLCNCNIWVSQMHIKYDLLKKLFAQMKKKMQKMVCQLLSTESS